MISGNILYGVLYFRAFMLFNAFHVLKFCGKNTNLYSCGRILKLIKIYYNSSIKVKAQIPHHQVKLIKFN